MPLSNLTKFHLHFYAVMAVSIAFGLSVLAGPVLLIMQLEASFLWLFPAWGVGQYVMLKWMQKVVDPLAERMKEADKNPFLPRYDLRIWAFALAFAAVSYVSYRVGHHDGREHMNYIVQQNCGTSLMCHAKYTFDSEKARSRAGRQLSQ